MKKLALIIIAACFARVSFAQIKVTDFTDYKEINKLIFNNKGLKDTVGIYDRASSKAAADFIRRIGLLRNASCGNPPKKQDAPPAELPSWASSRWIKDLYDNLPDLKTAVDMKLSKDKDFVVTKCEGRVRYDRLGKLLASVEVYCFGETDGKVKWNTFSFFDKSYSVNDANFPSWGHRAADIFASKSFK